MNTNRLNELFSKYIGNSLNEKEKTEFLRALDNPNNKEQFENLFEALWKTEWQANDKRLDKQSLARINRTLKKLPRRKNRTYLPWLAAACVSLLLTATYVLHQFYSRQETVSVLAQNYLEYISLPDGTLVILKKGSQLRYNTSFAEKRTLQLEGKLFLMLCTM